ncbi:hypothetical protein [Photobacterium sp. Hal280]|uniref:hypothetical protein n=1 Tax=Photobacterium sp. Hal280 TaxID=3035163 RepID=UPI00301C66FB
MLSNLSCCRGDWCAFKVVKKSQTLILILDALNEFDVKVRIFLPCTETFLSRRVSALCGSALFLAGLAAYEGFFCVEWDEESTELEG